ncbi:DNA polymerase IV [Maioricimonas rarisocia]|uniref:DNA polymerase IV n=2 Tax=Maioricimonas rarisocia TaxID=2528026 RepID=A0A517Z565_9PLAN|nr:DNA polymerase IV [Maioricimonas rarisocia]
MSLAEAEAMLEFADRERRPVRGSENTETKRGERFPCDPEADRQALRELAWDCFEYTPVVAIEEAETPECLLLDIAGCAHLFGGETAMCRGILQAFRQRGLQTRIALADTIGAAWALAHYGRSEIVRSSPPLVKTLAPLPVESLRLPPDVEKKLARLDLRRVGQLLKLPRSVLPSRFGKQLLVRLDQALGRRPEPVTPLVCPEPVEVERIFAEPIRNRDWIESVLEELIVRLTAQLQQRQLVAMQFTCRFVTPRQPSVLISGADTEPQKNRRPPAIIDLRLVAPTDSASYLQELFALQWERFHLPGEIDQIVLRAGQLGSRKTKQRALFDRNDDGNEAKLVALLDRLRGRLGRQSVMRARLVSEWLPEEQFRYEELLHGLPSITAGTFPPEWTATAEGSLPPRLYRRPLPLDVVTCDDRPIRLRWGRETFFVHDCEGPQRIETGWWVRRLIRRDYYRVATEDGRRLWVFRQRPRDAWFLHGEG